MVDIPVVRACRKGAIPQYLMRNSEHSVRQGLDLAFSCRVVSTSTYHCVGGR